MMLQQFTTDCGHCGKVSEIQVEVRPHVMFSYCGSCHHKNMKPPNEHEINYYQRLVHREQ